MNFFIICQKVLGEFGLLFSYLDPSCYWNRLLWQSYLNLIEHIETEFTDSKERKRTQWINDNMLVILHSQRYTRNCPEVISDRLRIPAFSHMDRILSWRPEERQVAATEARVRACDEKAYPRARIGTDCGNMEQ